MKKKYFTYLAIASTLALTGCTSEDSPTNPADSPASTEQNDPDNIPDQGSFAEKIPMTCSHEMMEYLSTLNEKDVDLFKHFGYQLSLGKNVIISPISLYMGISLIANGANDQALEEILSFMGMESGQLSTLNDFNREILDNSPFLDKDVVVKMANGIWVKDNVSVLPAFIDVAKKDYSADIFMTDYSSGALESANKWVNEKTDGMIPEYFQADGNGMSNFIGPLNILNAFYVNAPWDCPFDIANTFKGFFSNFEGKDKTVDMMANDNLSAFYYSDNEMTAVTIPLGSYGRYTISFIMPAEEMTPLENLVASLDSRMLEKAFNGYWGEGHVELPKFSVKGVTANFKAILENMGLSNLFHTNLTRLAEANELKIDQASQSIRFEIDENGGRGAGVTHFYPLIAPGPDHEPTAKARFVADRPFMFVLRETNTGSTLLMGAVSDI